MTPREPRRFITPTAEELQAIFELPSEAEVSHEAKDALYEKSLAHQYSEFLGDFGLLFKYAERGQPEAVDALVAMSEKAKKIAESLG
jgi:hypothetical protein